MTTNHRPALEGKRGKANAIGDSISHARALPQQNTLKYRREPAVDHATASDALRDLQRNLSASQDRDIKRRRIAEFETLDASADSDDEETNKLLLEIEQLKDAARPQFGRTVADEKITVPSGDSHDNTPTSKSEGCADDGAAGLFTRGSEDDDVGGRVHVTSNMKTEARPSEKSGGTNSSVEINQEKQPSAELETLAESDYDSEDSESETRALLEELQKIKREREATKKEFELVSDRSNREPESPPAKKDWRSDSVFSNRRHHTAPVSSESFTNDTLKSEFHKDFLKKYVR